MNKKEILDILNSAKDKNGDIPMRLVKQAFDKLSEPCEDTISRQEVVDAYGDWYVEEGTEEGFIGTVKQLLEGLPHAQRNGTWITDANDNNNAYCSECGLLTTKDLLKRIAIVGENKPKFCPNCGAKMEDKEW